MIIGSVGQWVSGQWSGGRVVGWSVGRLVGGRWVGGLVVGGFNKTRSNISQSFTNYFDQFGLMH